MSSIRYKVLTRPDVLKAIGRNLLIRFFGQFRDELNVQGLPLPPPDLAEADYVKAAARVLLHPEDLPARLNEALVAIDDLSTVHRFDALEAAPEWPRFQPLLAPGATRADLVLQVWLVAPAFLARIHNALRLTRLTAFEHAAAGVPADRRPPFDPGDKAAILNLTLGIDAWFARNSRGAETTRVEVYPLRGDYWHLIRHGDLFTRVPKVERQDTEILHFRPERDDVVVYAPALDELRVNARTKGERDLYFEQFGLHLRGRADYFSQRATYTLEPLRTLGPDALDAREIDGVEKIRLRELEVAFDGGQHEVITRAAAGLFERAALTPHRPGPIPSEGRLARAVFEFQFAGSAKSHPVEIRLPNVLKIGRRCDPQPVQAWLSQRHFRRLAPAEPLAA